MWEKTFGMTRRPPMCLNAGLSFFERFDEQKSREAIHSSSETAVHQANRN
jgi:hypothetical protein